MPKINIKITQIKGGSKSGSSKGGKGGKSK